MDRTLGTPTDAIWPGVKKLPDYKANFPTWPSKPLAKVCPKLDEAGLDLLGVSLDRNQLTISH